MATRYYTAVKVPNALIRGQMRGAWADGGILDPFSQDQYDWRASLSKSDAGAKTARVFLTNQQGNFDIVLYKFRTPPLEAQALSGTFNLCFFVGGEWSTLLGWSNASLVRYKIHVYSTVGQSTTVRDILIDNYVDSVNFNDQHGFPGQQWQSLASAQALAVGKSTVAGDTIVMEIGVRVVSSPTPPPTYPPTDLTRIDFGYTGATGADADAAAGGFVGAGFSPWLEFSLNLVAQAGPAAPANETCATAIVIPPTLPYSSSDIDTTAGTQTSREVWWTWTCPVLPAGADMAFFHTFGSNHRNTIAIFTGNCAALTPVGVPVSSNDIPHRGASTAMLLPTPGTKYWIRVRSTGSPFTATDCGGILRLSAGWRMQPVDGDLYIAAGFVCAYREGQLVSLTPAFTDDIPTGLAIDYTSNPMDDLNGGTHASHRLYVGLHAFNLVEVLDLATLSYGSGQSEIDWIDDAWNLGTTAHPASLYITAAGTLYAGWFGDGYLYVCGAGALPALQSTISSNAAFSALKRIASTHGDNQSGAPWAFAEQIILPIETSAPWALDIAESADIVYYTSGTVYRPTGAVLVKKWDLAGAVPLADLATITTTGMDPKGLAVLADGTVLITNQKLVERRSAAGALLQTYEPSPAPSIDGSAYTDLIDVVLTPDGLSFWTMDARTTHVYKFNIATGAQTLDFDTHLFVRSTVQMVVYDTTPDVPPPEPPPPAACPAVLFIDPSSAHPGCAAPVFY